MAASRRLSDTAIVIPAAVQHGGSISQREDVVLFKLGPSVLVRLGLDAAGFQTVETVPAELLLGSPKALATGVRAWGDPRNPRVRLAAPHPSQNNFVASRRIVTRQNQIHHSAIIPLRGLGKNILLRLHAKLLH
ncbi:MAG: hypothetical protein KJZ93_24530, partial [Caldilineaceae bacterium]|nr:hypothetical protein [Caldilineaceae bacterium]